MTGIGWNLLDKEIQNASMRIILRILVVSTVVFLASAGFAGVVQAQNTRGSATGPTTAKGYEFLASIFTSRT
jgi:hypothetical protein